MSYMLLIVEPVGQRAQRTPDEGREAYAQMVRYAEGLKSRGLLVSAESLKSESESVRLQIRDGERSLMDGPYAEAKEKWVADITRTINKYELYKLDQQPMQASF